MRWVGRASPGNYTSALILFVFNYGDATDNKRSKKCRGTFSVLKEAGEESCQISHGVGLTEGCTYDTIQSLGR